MLGVNGGGTSLRASSMVGGRFCFVCTKSRTSRSVHSATMPAVFSDGQRLEGLKSSGDSDTPTYTS